VECSIEIFWRFAVNCGPNEPAKQKFLHLVRVVVPYISLHNTCFPLSCLIIKSRSLSVNG